MAHSFGVHLGVAMDIPTKKHKKHQFGQSHSQGSVEEWPISQEGRTTEVVGELAPQQGAKVCGLA